MNAGNDTELTLTSVPSLDSARSSPLQHAPITSPARAWQTTAPCATFRSYAFGDRGEWSRKKRGGPSSSNSGYSGLDSDSFCPQYDGIKLLYAPSRSSLMVARCSTSASDVTRQQLNRGAQHISLGGIPHANSLLAGVCCPQMAVASAHVA